MNSKAGQHGRVLLVEMAGLAGVGKSTLSRALCQRSERFIIGAEVSLRQKDFILLAARELPLILLRFILQNSGGRWFTWDEIKTLIYLKGAQRIFKRQASGRDVVILLDHGPIFKLATLHAFGPPMLRDRAAGSWWFQMFKQWSDLLDLVVWLDAPEAVLTQRIDGRDQRHAVKGKSESEAAQFLARYRQSFKYVLSSIIGAGKPAMVEFDTAQKSIEDIVEAIMEKTA